MYIYVLTCMISVYYINECDICLDINEQDICLDINECDISLDINECDIPGSCSQVCYNHPGGHKCDCVTGYMKVGL